MKNIEEIKKISILDVDFPENARRYLRSHGYATLGDLSEKDALIIQNTCDDRYTYMHIRNILHRFGLTFKGEYDKLGLTSDIANVDVKDLEISSALKNIITRSGCVNTLGELLTTDYDILFHIRNMGIGYMKELKQYVHNLGYEIQNEVETIEEKKEKLRQHGVDLLEDVFESSKLCNILYRNDIYTVDDLLARSGEVFNLVGLGPLRKKNYLKVCRV